LPQRLISKTAWAKQGVKLAFLLTDLSLRCHWTTPVRRTISHPIPLRFKDFGPKWTLHQPSRGTLFVQSHKAVKSL
jgi:hypothetical protein